jgi:hypothetical protein
MAENLAELGILADDANFARYAADFNKVRRR